MRCSCEGNTTEAGRRGGVGESRKERTQTNTRRSAEAGELGAFLRVSVSLWEDAPRGKGARSRRLDPRLWKAKKRRRKPEKTKARCCCRGFGGACWCLRKTPKSPDFFGFHVNSEKAHRFALERTGGSDP